MALTPRTPCLTLENLKRLDTTAGDSYYYHSSSSPSSPSSSSADDNESLFSASSAHLSVECAPEDEEPPRTITDQDGVPVIVYSSLDQAVRYSVMRVAEQRRREEAARPSSSRRGGGSWYSFPVLGTASSPAAYNPIAVPSVSVESVAGPFYEDEEDEDAYFSMG